MLTKSIFLWLNRLNSFICLSIDFNYTKNMSYNDNFNMSKVGNKVFYKEEMPPINFNYTKNKDYDDIYSKNYCNINDEVDI